MAREVAVTDKLNNVAVWSILNDDVVEGLTSGLAAELVNRKSADDAIVAGLTQGSTAGPEIALARGTYAALGGRIDQIEERVFDVKKYGAKGDGTTDDTTAINNAAAAAKAAGGILFGQGTFLISGTITIMSSGDLSRAKFLVAAGTVSPAVRVGDQTSGVWTANLDLNLPTVTFTGKAALGVGVWAANVGVEFVNLYSCRVSLGRVTGFGTNYRLTAIGTGNVYNTYFLGWSENGKIGLRLAPGTGGWVNENLFLGGRMAMDSAEGTAIVGSRHILCDTAASLPNNNRFIGVSVEANGPEFHLEDYGSDNIYEGLRWEAASPKVHFAGTAKNNVILYGYNATAIVITEAADAFYNHLYHRGGSRLIGTSSRGGVFVGANSTDGADGVFVALAAGDKLASDAAARYCWRAGAAYTQMKRATDTFPRFEFDHQNSILRIGGGTATPTVEITWQTGMNALRMSGAAGGVGGSLAVGTVTALPSPVAAWRGMMLRILGGAGVSDVFYICKKDAVDAYVWVTIA